MSSVTVHDPKDPAEVLDILIDATERLNGATVEDGPGLVVTMASEQDAAATLMLVGPADVAGRVITQRVKGGLPSATYVLRVEFDTSDDQHMVEVVVIPVRRLGY